MHAFVTIMNAFIFKVNTAPMSWEYLQSNPTQDCAGVPRGL